jgi:hypothetical protein
LTLLDRQIVAVVTFELEKTGDLTHRYSAACSDAFAISASARRYSTGITLRNIGNISSSRQGFPQRV